MENKIKPAYHIYSKGDEVIIAFDDYDEKDLFEEWLLELGINSFEEYKKINGG